MEILDLNIGIDNIRKFVEEKKGEKLWIENIKRADKYKLDMLQILNCLKFNDVQIMVEDQKRCKLYINAFELCVRQTKFKIINYFEQNREIKELILQFSIDSVYLFQSRQVQNADQFEYVTIICQKNMHSECYMNNSLIDYIRQFNCIQHLKIDISKSIISQDSYDSIIQFSRDITNVQSITIFLYHLTIFKYKDTISISQTISSHKNIFQLPQSQIQNKLKLVNHLHKLVDLTSPHRNTILENILDDYQQTSIISCPKTIKIAASIHQLQQANQILQKYKDISTVIIIFSQQLLEQVLQQEQKQIIQQEEQLMHQQEEQLMHQQEEQLMHQQEQQEKQKENLHELLSKLMGSLNKLKKLTIIDDQNNNFIELNKEMMEICQKKHLEFNMTHDMNQKNMIKYTQSDKYLSIKYAIGVITDVQFSELFQHYQRTHKISIIADYHTIQSAINTLHRLSKLSKIKLVVLNLKHSLDFSPIYHQHIHKLKVMYCDYSKDAEHLYLSSIQSQLNHPTCPNIASDKFSLKLNNKTASIQINSYQQCHFYSSLIQYKYSMTQFIKVYPPHKFYSCFFASICLLPYLERVTAEKSNPYQIIQDKELVENIFFDIKIQKIQIATIKKHLSDFIPIYLPSLFYDLYN